MPYKDKDKEKQLVDHELVSWEGDINGCIGTST